MPAPGWSLAEILGKLEHQSKTMIYLKKLKRRSNQSVYDQTYTKLFGIKVTK